MKLRARSRLTLLALLLTALALPGGDAFASQKTYKSRHGKPVKLTKARTAKGTPALVAKRGSVRSSAAAKAEAASYADAANGRLKLMSSSVVVQDPSTGAVLFEKNSGAVLPIASITKLMTAMVTLDANLSLNEHLTIGDSDVDMVKHSTSRVPVGSSFTRQDALRLALMASENRAAHTLARHYPGGVDAFVLAMNEKARELGLHDTRFHDPTGLNAGNVSSARDLAKMVAAASSYPLIREFSTTANYPVALGRRTRMFQNTNALVRGGSWDIDVSKTGYINESGKCLVMQARFNNKPTIIVLLDSWGKMTRIGDANRIKRWIEANNAKLALRPDAQSDAKPG